MRVKREQQDRPPRSQQVPFPNIVLSNVQSLGNKVDEISVLMKRRTPDIAVFTETWLNDTYEDSAIKMENYATIRKDRTNGRGGGVVCYTRDLYSFSVIGELEVPSLNSLRSELLCVFIAELFLFVIIIYHPLWNDNDADSQAISCIVDIVDFPFVTYSRNVRILLCGDFNDLRHRYSELSSLTNLHSVVKFPTRCDNVLDQISVNFATSQSATKLPPIGCSDHCVVSWSPPPPRKFPVVKKIVRKFSLSKLISFRYIVSDVDWVKFVSSFDNLNDSVTSFIDHLVALFNHIFPT